MKKIIIVTIVSLFFITAINSQKIESNYTGDKCNEFVDLHKQAECFRSQAKVAFENGDIVNAVNLLDSCLHLTEFDTITRFNDYLLYADYLSKSSVQSNDTIFTILNKASEIHNYAEKRFTKEDKIKLLSVYGRSYMISKDFGKASSILKKIEKDFEEELIINTDRLTNLLSLAGLYLESNNPVVARELFTKAQEMSISLGELPPNYPAALNYNLGRATNLLGEYNKSIDYFHNAQNHFSLLFGTEYHPALTSCKAYNTLNLIGIGDLALAEKSALTVIEENMKFYGCPSRELFYNHLEYSQVLIEKKEYDKASSQIEKAFSCLGIDPFAEPESQSREFNYDVIQGLTEIIRIATLTSDNSAQITKVRNQCEQIVDDIYRRANTRQDIRDNSGLLRSYIEASIDNKLSNIDDSNKGQYYYGLLGQTALVKESQNIDGDKNERKVKDNQLIISYFVGNETIFCFVEDKDHKDIISINRDLVLENKLSNESLNSEEYRQGLYNYLISPLESFLDNKKRIMISPDSWINNVPFEAIQYKGEYLLSNYAISYNPLLKETEEEAIPAKIQKAVAFAPSFDQNATNLGAIQSIRSVETGELGPLFFSDEEVTKVAKITGGKKLIGNSASKKAFFEHVNHADLLHLSTHGQSNHLDDELNFVVFDPSLNDNILYSKELKGFSIETEMVVLSACETSAGMIHNGAGTLSIGNDFIQAGAKSVITTLWSVNDKSTSLIMGYFYENLAKGMTKDIALQKAKISYLSQNPEIGSSPYFWAGIIPHGDMKSLKFSKKNNLGFFYAIACGLILSIFIFFLLRKRKNKSIS